MPAFGSEFIVVGRTLAAIVVHAPDPALSIGFLEGAGTTLTLYQWRKRFADGPRSGLPRFAEVIVDSGAARDAAIEIESERRPGTLQKSD